MIPQSKIIFYALLYLSINSRKPLKIKYLILNINLVIKNF